MNRDYTSIALSCIVVLAAITGCANQSGQSAIRDESKVAEIQVGKSTTVDVQRILGVPFSTQRAGDQLAWVYISNSIHATAFIPFLNMAGNTYDSQNMTITFDGKGVVKSVDRGQTHN